MLDTAQNYKNLNFQYQGDEVIDVDLPTLVEAKLFCTTGGKLLWIILQPFFYSLRPLVVRPKPPTPLEAINLIIQLFFDAIVVKIFGELVFLFIYFILVRCSRLGITHIEAVMAQGHKYATVNASIVGWIPTRGDQIYNFIYFFLSL